MAPTVFMDPEHGPTQAEIAAALGPVAPLWGSLAAYIDESYGIEPAFVQPSRKYGWALKYRKGGRTLVSLTPDEGSFTALLVLGAAESDAARELDLGEHVRHLLEEATQYHDGRWLFIEVQSERDVRDIQALLAVKRRPQRRATRTAA